jgi:hypothetical protein
MIEVIYEQFLADMRDGYVSNVRAYIESRYTGDRMEWIIAEIEKRLKNDNITGKHPRIY